MPKFDKNSISWKTLVLGVILNVLVIVVGFLVYHAYITKGITSPLI